MAACDAPRRGEEMTFQVLRDYAFVFIYIVVATFLLLIVLAALVYGAFLLDWIFRTGL